MIDTIEYYMKEAIACAQERSTPYGATLLQPEEGKKVIAANAVGQDGDPTAHAEIVALRQANQQGVKLEGSILISTCEPCPCVQWPPSGQALAKYTMAQALTMLRSTEIR